MPTEPSNSHLLFLSYWNLEDGLTASTVFPHLRLLTDGQYFNQITFSNIQRTDLPDSYGEKLLQGMDYLPLRTPRTGGVSVYSFAFHTALLALIKVHGAKPFTHILARGVIAGGMALKLSAKLNIPFYVESFEPHSVYMTDSRVWKGWDLRTQYLKNLEKKQKKHAAGLMPVARNYQEKLLQEGIPADRIRTVPCTVFQPERVQSQPSETGVFPAGKVNCIYLGKLGGMYLDPPEFVRLISALSDLFDGNLYTFIGTTTDMKPELQSEFNKIGYPETAYQCTRLDHDQIWSVLTSSHFGIAPYKPGDSKKYLSPVKIGEYWWAGLPVLLTDGVGDEAGFIESEQAGVLFNPYADSNSLKAAVDKLRILLSNPGIKDHIKSICRKYRDPDQVRTAYDYFFRN